MARIFRLNHLRRGDFGGGQIFKMAPSLFIDVSEEEINIIKENAVPRNTKHATKRLLILHKGKMRKLCQM